MLVLVETPAGYGLFKVQDAKLLSMDLNEVEKHFETPAKAQEQICLQAFAKFKETKEAMAEAAAMIESKMGKGLKKFLKKNIVKAAIDNQLAVCDKSLGSVIKNKLGIDVVFNANTTEIIRGIRTQLHDLVSGLSEQDTRTMALGLSHSLNRFKLKFSPEKVDTMIIQAIGLLDDLDRELNNFAMRLKEWYGWHFPELAKIVTDNLTYAQAIKAIGMRNQTQHTDLSSILPVEMIAEVKQAAEISMGTEITEEDLKNIFELAQRVQELTEYRASLADYLKYRMNAMAPNLTYMVGELVGARLISHSGSLMGLAKHPSSTVQILGAEKALFRALKTKTQTPKYGLIYHATLVGQSSPKYKGKISRVLAAKLSLCIRVDALGDQTVPTVGIGNRSYVERRLEEIENESARGLTKSFAKPQIPKYEPQRGPLRNNNEQYDANADDAKVHEVGAIKKKRKLSAGGGGAEDRPSKKKNF